MAGDDNVIGLGLGNTGGHRTDADFGDELHGDRSDRVRVFQIVDQLRQILNRIDVMMRRWRDQTDTRHRVAQEADVFTHFVARQLTAFTRLGALSHLDLDLIRVGQVFGGDTETARGHLLDRRAQRIAGLQFDIAFDTALADNVGQLLARFDLAETTRVFAAFAGIRLAANSVHGDGQRGMRFGRDRTQRHGAGGETLNNFAGRFDFIERNRRTGRFDFEKTPQRHMALGLIVNDAGVFFKGFVFTRTRRMLQLGDCVGRPQMFFTADTEGILAAGFQQIVQDGIMRKGTIVHAQCFFNDFVQTNTFDLGRGTGEVFLHKVGGQTNRFEDLCTVVRLIGRDTHLRHHLAQALVDGFDVAFAGLVR